MPSRKKPIPYAPPANIDELQGWVDPGRVVIESFLNDPARIHTVFAESAPQVEYKKKDTHLWKYLLACKPNWRRGKQGIGDCVSWGAELACSVLYAKMCVKRKQPGMFVEAATESIYGGARVEAAGRSSGGFQDGANGMLAAKWVHDWGVLLRKDYSAETGIAEHDLSTYSSEKAKSWGNYGCGGQKDKGALDLLAKLSPLKEVSQARSFDDLARSICLYECPVTNASMYGTDMKRNKYGECVWNGSWSHQQVYLAVRFGKRPAALKFQSWGANVVSGPSGDEYTEGLDGPTPAAILGCSWWVPAEDVDRELRSGDCWAFGDVANWTVPRVTDDVYNQLVF
jgi:hypothetical protein